MHIAIIYTSVTANTEELAIAVHQTFTERSISADLYHIREFPNIDLSDYDGVVVGTYTWQNGTIPAEMMPVYEWFEQHDCKDMVTGVIGSGDSFFPYFCGAVDEFRDMLYVRTDLAVTLKVELRPQRDDVAKCSQFVTRMEEKFEARLALV